MQPKRIDDIFWDAAQLASLGERNAYLDNACADNAELRQRVEELLQARSKAEGFLEAPTTPPGATVAEPPPAEGAGTKIGPYQLIEQLGEGGMGTVWLARQTGPVKRLVAVKLIKAGMGSNAGLARFEAERQALARMDHPNIARILDGGATADGRPFFVMEQVKGLPITRYCDEHRLTLRQRLDLFVPVCQALQHAHQKGIIHRDIKPSNVLVARGDDGPVPKVIDFGVAKAVGQQLTEQTLNTGLGGVVGTLEYMSPEQAGLNQFDVDTRSDVYALGVLLYELLAGSPPLRRKELESGGLLEILRAIREQEPPRPSARLSSADGLPSLAANRGTEPKRLTALVRGELDWIVMKALEKDRSRRYETANDLARDIERHVHDETVLACPPSARYRLQKFARRNRSALLMAALSLLAVVTLTGSIGWIIGDRTARSAEANSTVLQALQESQAQQKAGRWDEAKAAATRAEGLVASGASVEVQQRVKDRRTDLDMVSRLENLRLTRFELPGGEHDFAGVDRAFATAFREYGLDVEVLPTTTAVAQISARTIPLELAVALDDWGEARRRAKEGDPALVRFMQIAQAVDPDDWRNRLRTAVWKRDRGALKSLAATADLAVIPATTQAHLGAVLGGMGEHEAAVAFLRKAQTQNPGDFWINFSLGISLGWKQPAAWDEATRCFAMAVALRPRHAVPQGALGWALLRKGSLDASGTAFRKAIELDGHYFEAHVLLGQALNRQGQWHEAFAAHRNALALRPTNAWVNSNFFGVYLGARSLDQEAWARRLGVDVEVTNSVGMKMRLIPPGKVAMTGTFSATLKQPYRIGSHEVTVAQFRPFVTETDFKTDAENSPEGGTILVNQRQYRKPEYTWKQKTVAQGDDYPVAQLSWNDAVKFCEWLSQKEGKIYRLPTEAEWEWACRAGSRTAYHFGDDTNALGEHAWYDANSGGRSHPVGTKKRNPWGLFDMHGNVAEYCQDWDAPLPTGHATDPRGPKYGQYRVLRSLTFIDRAGGLTAGNRARFVPDRSMMHMGFRVVVEFGVKELPSPPKESSSRLEIEYNGVMMKERSKAVAALEETVRAHPRNPDFLLWLARGLAAQGECDKAFRHYTRLIEINPNNSQLWRERALLDARRGEWGKAAAGYAEMLKKYPFDLNRSCDYAFLLLLAGDCDRYRQVCGSLLERFERIPDPSNAFHVARICALSPETAVDPARSVRQGELAVRDNPTAAWHLHALSLAHYRAGQFDQALRRLNESYKDGSWSSQPMNWVLLAMVHHRLGHAEVARRFLDRFDGWREQSANAVPYEWGGFPLHPQDWMACLVLRREADALLGPPRKPPLRLPESKGPAWQELPPKVDELLPKTKTSGPGPTLDTPAAGAVLANSASERGDNSKTWSFSWSTVPGAARYHLQVKWTRANIPVINDATLTTTSFQRRVPGYVSSNNILDWRWKVRALINGSWTDWSEERRFDIEPSGGQIPGPRKK